MFRPLIAAGAIALALPAFALAQPAPAPTDPSNPAGAPLSPSLDRANQPGRGDDSRILRDAEAMSGSATADAETEADRKAREEAARPKPTRTVRMGERTVATKAVLRQ